LIISAEDATTARYAEDVDRLHDRDDPVMDLDRVIHLGSLKPRRKLAQPIKERGVHWDVLERVLAAQPGIRRTKLHCPER
jgi:hypothetical protein